MMTFFLGTGLMTLFLLIVLLIPLLTKGRKKADQNALPQANLAIYRDQFKELEDELARGSITQKEYDEGHTELERRVLEDSAPQAAMPENTGKVGLYTSFAFVILIPISAALLWTVTQPLGDFRMDGGKYEAIADYNSGQIVKNSGQEMHDMEQALEKLRNHLREDPSDLQGWMMYGRSMLTMRRYSEAVSSFDRALQLAPGNPAIMVDLADAIAMVQGQDLKGQPWELINRVLSIDPTNWKALMMAGTDYFNRGDYRMAVMYWERLLKTLNPTETGLVDAVKASIQEARQLGKIIGPVPDTLSFGKADDHATQQSPMMSQMMKGGAAPMSQSPVPQEQVKPMQVTHTVSGTIEITPELMEKIGDKDVLYVTARPATGGRMPIAQLQMKILDFPVHFTIDNTMLPPMDMGAGTLDKHEKVIITARLSRDHAPMPQNGDIDGKTENAVAVGADDVKVTLNNIVAK